MRAAGIYLLEGWKKLRRLSRSEGSRVNVTATHKSGFQFDKWSDGNTSASRTINVTQNLSLTASFKAVSSGGNTEPGGEDDDDNPDFL